MNWFKWFYTINVVFMTVIYLPNVPVASFQERCNGMTLHKTLDEMNFYSSTGIFTLRNNQIYKHIYKPKQIETIQRGDIVLYKDNSDISYKEVYSQLPSDYNIIKIKKKIYCMKQDYPVVFVIVFKDNVLYDCYMETTEKIDNSVIISSALSFLSR